MATIPGITEASYSYINSITVGSFVTNPIAVGDKISAYSYNENNNENFPSKATLIPNVRWALSPQVKVYAGRNFVPGMIAGPSLPDDSGLINSTLITISSTNASTISITSIQTNLSQYLTFYNNGGGKLIKDVNQFPYLCATQELACINTFWTDAYKSIPEDKKDSSLIALNEILRWNFYAVIKR